MPTAFQLSAAALQQMLRQSSTIAAGEVVLFKSDEVDFLTVGNYGFADLARAGYKLANIAGVAYWEITARTGVVTAGPTTKAGNDVGHTNIIASHADAPTTAQTTVGQVYFGSNAVPAALVTDDLSTAPVIEVTLAATGATVFKGKLWLWGTLVPV